MVRILIGGLIGVAVLVPVGGLFNDLVSGGLLAMGTHNPFRLVSYDLERLAGPAALAVQLGLYFLMGAVVGVSTLPFADDGATLVRRSLAHFAATAGALTLLVCLCGWNWGKVVPLVVYLALLAAVYLLIWLVRWAGWYAEVAAIRAKLGLIPGSSPLKWRETLPYVPLALALCLGVPWLLRQLEGSGMPLLSGTIYAQLLLPVGCLASGMWLGKRHGFCPLYPVVCGVGMLAAVFLLYNYTVLILFCAIAFGSALLGVAAGAYPRKKEGD
nr:DUF3021 family protein [Pseudoflavonifractor phocaeensis]